ncbi:LCP family protein [Murimonas intestini]|uniref:LytR family transcriptional attenuator n=1 Tax=Murimonas intestini TaxID=1337051 RepID=A0AB73T8A0_9FIRM|nr:LCP family protein [Murimonas intestini]MCR1866623.1 LCP family protein [Murimonas intestini]MCR1884753.1 LCP family protein [Murimonas intestini]
MKILSDFSKALETMSSEIEAVPAVFYAAAGGIAAVFIILYFLIFPKMKMEEQKKTVYQRYCINGLFLVYLAGILTVTLFTREVQNEARVQLILLNDLWEADHLGKAAVRDILNLALFIPAGFLVCWHSQGKWRAAKGTIAAFLISLGIESAQFLGKTGTFDVDDILFNMLGGAAGAFILLAFKHAFGGKSAARYCLRGVLVLSSASVFCIMGILGTYHFLRVSGAEAVKDNVSTVENRMVSRQDGTAEGEDNTMYSYDPDLIWYGGRAYRYNENLTTILIMGIDQRSEVIEKREGISGESGQADTIFLLVLNHEKEKMKIIGISRDTMTDIKTFDYKGNYLGESINHLGLAYAFGDGKEKSCQYMVDAVSNLFYGIPVNAYVALNMEAVIGINDAVGGVTVTVPEDLSKADKELKKGVTVTLMGRQALTFMKWRDTGIDYSNNLRMARQKLYIISFLKQALKAVKDDMALPLTLYQNLTDEMVTDITPDEAVYLSTQILSMSLDESGIMMLKGDSARGSVYDEVYVDDKALYELILNIFYTEVKTEGGQ